MLQLEKFVLLSVPFYVYQKTVSVERQISPAQVDIGALTDNRIEICELLHFQFSSVYFQIYVTEYSESFFNVDIGIFACCL